MDEAISLFIEEMGNPTSHESVPSTAIEHYRTKLPGRLLNYWEDYGWSAHAGGIFWIVNPAEYEGVVRSWLEGTAFEARDIYHVIARTAFGCLYLWGKKPVTRWISTPLCLATPPMNWARPKIP